MLAGPVTLAMRGIVTALLTGFREMRESRSFHTRAIPGNYADFSRWRTDPEAVRLKTGIRGRH
jgi:hypothetical protein